MVPICDVVGLIAADSEAAYPSPAFMASRSFASRLPFASHLYTQPPPDGGRRRNGKGHLTEPVRISPSAPHGKLRATSVKVPHGVHQRSCHVADISRAAAAKPSNWFLPPQLSEAGGTHPTCARLELVVSRQFAPNRGGMAPLRVAPLKRLSLIQPASIFV
ncbi:hypothetical protein JG687_00009083 [Phytophthora cactorum]|uniref:Uncharacterized protein n=1 Tax=Phytophthora cactorum TaxID=29920 RepID=A0A8T1UFM9_9STRA|nr:hypothetical protein GQ600_5348 [Phytophthora cactorum]KAG6958921.1 hypothetical protein JG687_00009083 [Phytophthora cactorum]